MGLITHGGVQSRREMALPFRAREEEGGPVSSTAITTLLHFGTLTQSKGAEHFADSSKRSQDIRLSARSKI